MKSRLPVTFVLCTAGMFIQSTNAAVPSPAANGNDNPLLTESTLPYHMPPFDKLKDEHFAPAMEQGMAEELKEMEAIAANRKSQPSKIRL